MNSAECYEAHEVSQQFVIAGCDAPEVLEFVEESLNGVAILIKLLVVVVLVVSVGHGRNDRCCARVENGVVEIVGVITTVGDDIVAGDVIDQFERAFDIGLLARTGDETDRIAQGIGGGMDFRAQAAA